MIYTILVSNTISESSNLNICFYHCLILTLIFHLKVLINFFFFFFIIIIISSSSISISISITIIITIVVVFVVVLLLSIIYTINLFVVQPRFCRVIYYFDTIALERKHQSFSRVTTDTHCNMRKRTHHNKRVVFTTWRYCTCHPNCASVS